MSLSTLNRFEPPKAKAILAEAILSHGLDVPPSIPQSYPEEVTELINEVRHRLEIDDSDNSSRTKTRITEILSLEVTRIASAGRDLKEVAENLGQKGQLPLGAYKIHIVDGILREMKEAKSVIERVIREADEVQHITGTGPLSNSATGLTLIMKWVRTEKSAFWYLLDAQRTKDTLRVAGIYRIDPEAIDLTNAATPLDVLKRFVARYGLPFHVKGLPGDHFFLEDVRVDDPPSEATRSVNTKGVKRFAKYLETGYEVGVSKMGAGGPFNLLKESRIVAAYAINVSKYLEDRPSR